MTSDQNHVARAAIVGVCRRLYERGLIAGPDGNVSMRLIDGSILVTPAGRSKIDVTPEELVLVDRDGAVLDGGTPSSELGMHLRIYQRRTDVHAVVHAHPPTATGFAVAGEGFVAPVLPEVILQMGAVPVMRYCTPGTQEVGDALEEFLDAGHTAVLMANHGATTLGRTLNEAHQRMESVEHAARILLTARLLGRVNELTVTETAALRRSSEGI
ncbi:MAG: class II aldolase/adducin family protein [Gemmatimonadaceae bacterium]